MPPERSSLQSCCVLAAAQANGRTRFGSRWLATRHHNARGHRTQVAGRVSSHLELESRPGALIWSGLRRCIRPRKRRQFSAIDEHTPILSALLLAVWAQQFKSELRSAYLRGRARLFVL